MEGQYQGREVEIMTRLVDCLRDMHSPADAVLILDKLVEIEPRNFDARQLRRRMQMWSYEQDASLNKPILALKTQSILSGAVDDGLDPIHRVEIAEKALALNPFHHKANLLLAQSARLLGWGQIVTMAYETLVYRYPENKEYQMELASIYYHHQEPERALAIYEEMLEEDPDDLDAHEAAVRLERELEEEAATVPIPEPVKPPSDRVVEELEHQLKELEGELDSLQEEFHRMAKVDDSDRQVLAEASQRVDIAHLDLLEAEAQRNPEDLEIHYHLGQAREKVGMFAEAYEAYERLLESPDAFEEASMAMTVCLVSRAYQQYAYAHPEAGDEEPPAEAGGTAAGDKPARSRRVPTELRVKTGNSSP